MERRWWNFSSPEYHGLCEDTAAEGPLCGDRIDPQYEKLGTEEADRI